MSTTPVLTPETLENRNWWTYLNGYHWFVLIVCALGWMFDCADQIIFYSSRAIALRDLMPGTPDKIQTQMGGYVTMVFMIGWASGGLVFGIIGDKWGRAKTMGLTIFLYALFTGLSALSQNWQQFAASRFLTGFGVGGEFAAGAALVADVMPSAARAQALGMLQALSAIGNVLGALMLQVVTVFAGNNEHLVWRYLYFVGALPAIIAVFVMIRMREPEKWEAAKAAAKETGDKSMGKISDLFAIPRWRRNTLVGLALAISGVIGVWGIGFYSPELIDKTFPPMTEAAAVSVHSILDTASVPARAAMVSSLEVAAKQQQPDGKLTPEAATAKNAVDAYRRLLDYTVRYKEVLPDDLSTVEVDSARRTKMEALLSKRMEPKVGAALKSNALMLQQFGAFCGMLVFSMMAVRIGRRFSFAISFVLAWAAIYLVFLGFHDPHQIWYMYPVLGFCTLLPFGGYAVYFPELFPTRLRTTGTGFCYNVGRYIAALGPPMLTSLSVSLAGRFETPSFRVAAVIVSSVYVIGIVASFMGPETKDQPLPDDERVVAH